MKKEKRIVMLFATFSLLVPYLLSGQGFKEYLSPADPAKIVMLGEIHWVAEAQDIEYNIIEHYAESTPGKVVLFFEYSYSMNYFMERLFQLGDSAALQYYIRHEPDDIEHLREVESSDVYHLFMRLYYLNKRTQNLQVKFMDRERNLRPLLYTLLSVLEKYDFEKKQIRIQIASIKQWMQRNIDTGKDFPAFAHTFFSHFRKHARQYAKTLSAEDYHFITQLEKYAKRYTGLEREELMYRCIAENYIPGAFHITYNGANHVNKIYLDTTAYYWNIKSLGSLLNTKEDSPFKDKVFSIYIPVAKVKIPEHTFTDIFNNSKKREATVKNGNMDQIPVAEKKMLLALSDWNIFPIVPDKERFPVASKFFDLIILIREGNTSIAF